MNHMGSCPPLAGRGLFLSEVNEKITAGEVPAPLRQEEPDFPMLVLLTMKMSGCSSQLLRADDGLKVVSPPRAGRTCK